MEYPHKFNQSITIEFLRSFDKILKKGERKEKKLYSLSGRIITKRSSGKNLNFFKCLLNGEDFQVIASKKLWRNENYKEEIKKIKVGDTYGFSGFIGKSNPKNHEGEVSIFAHSCILLAPCKKNLILKNIYSESNSTKIETNYKQRYLDLILNKNTRNRFIKRSNIIKYLRKYLDNLQFIEVETPILSQEYSGALAKPFITTHNYLNKKMYMRIAPELYLKKLVIGGMEKVYEIGKQFRNENIDSTHNPEFTSLEFYIAYSDYNDLMKMTEDLLSGLVLSITGDYKINYGDYNIDFTPPYKRIDIVKELEYNIGKIEYNVDFLLEKCKKNKISYTEPLTIAKLLDKLICHYIEEKCINPTFIINHPIHMSPLAKQHRDNEMLTERFELFAAKNELCNAYTELNDPDIQKERFATQDKNDEEKHTNNKDYIEALKYGLPPTAGFGMGIDRLVMLLTNQKSIKEVILFPK